MNVTRTSIAIVTSAGLLVAGAALIPWVQSPVRISALEGPLAQAPSKPAAGAPPVLAVDAPGRVEPKSQTLELAFGAIGTLQAVDVAEGDSVHRGQVLAELDNADLRARVDEAKATVALREAQLQKLMNGARIEERQEAAARVSQAEADLSYAQAEYRRHLPLFKSGTASRQAMDQTQSSFEAAQAKHAAVAAALALLDAPPRAEDVAIAKANLALARANLAEQQALLEKTLLRSPIDGVVLRRYLRTGEAAGVTPPTPIIEVGDTDRLRVRAEVDQTDIGRIAVGDRAWVTADAYPGRRFGGVVARLGQRVGRKRVHTDDPTDKSDTQVLDAWINLDEGTHLPVGLRVDVVMDPTKIARR